MCCNPTGPSLCGFDPLAPTRSKICGVTLVALGVLMLALTALMIYNLATAPPTNVWCEFHQVVHEVSLKPFIAFPVLFLGIPAILLLYCGFNKFDWSSCASPDSGLPLLNAQPYVPDQPMADDAVWK